MENPAQRLIDAIESLELKEFPVLWRNLRSHLTPTAKEEALRISCLVEKHEIVLFLLDEGVDINCADAEGQTPLMLSAENLNINLVSLLLGRGAKVDLQDSNGASALFRAVDAEIQMAVQQSLNRHIEPASKVSRVLLELGADPGLSTKSGASALSIAALHKFGHFIALVELNRAAEKALKQK